MKFETSRFRLHQFERRFEDDILPGDDVASWLRAHLRAMQGQVFGLQRYGDWWTFDILWDGEVYRLGVQISEEKREERPRPVNGGAWARWRLILATRPSLFRKLFFRNKNGRLVGLCNALHQLLRQQHDFNNVVVKEDDDWPSDFPADAFSTNPSVHRSRHNR